MVIDGLVSPDGRDPLNGHVLFPGGCVPFGDPDQFPGRWVPFGGVDLLNGCPPGKPFLFVIIGVRMSELPLMVYE